MIWKSEKQKIMTIARKTGVWTCGADKRKSGGFVGKSMVKILIFLFAAITMLSMAGPAFSATGDSCTRHGQPGTRDCNNNCKTNTWINKRLNNGTCNWALRCEEFNFDGGDCAPGASCWWGSGKRDCTGQCRSNNWINSRLGNGSCNSQLECSAFAFDNGDCVITCYHDADGDGYGDNGTTGDCSTPGYISDNTDCDDTSSSVNPGASEICNGIDDNCDGNTDEGLIDTYYQDSDGDGYGTGTGNTTCNPPAGWVTDNSDCDDTRATVHPGASELCDGLDNDCDGGIDENFSWGQRHWYYPDLDGDGYGHGDHSSRVRTCAAPPGYAGNNTDCDDNNAAINPGESEVCNGVDDNCDGNIDEGMLITYYRDSDNDGYGNPSISTDACALPSGYVSDNHDCDDSNPAVNPGATEACNGIDDNCDGQVDEGLLHTYYRDSDNDGYGNPSNSTNACTVPSGYVSDNHDCDDSNPAVNPGATEVCNGVDDDCDGNIDEGLLTTYYEDSDNDGYGNPSSSTQACSPPGGYVADNTDCNDTNADINPGETEICDTLDNDCDGQVDEGFTTNTYYADADGDGYGDPTDSVQACGPSANYVANNTDCNDNDANINPGAFDVCENGIDENCNGADRSCSQTGSVCANLADIPLETQVESAPPIVMFLFDDSGSMNWDTLCPENNGKFDGSSSYSSKKRYWKSQFAGYNGVYYDPALDYSPWPDSASTQYSDANPDYPRYHPDSSSTRNLNSTFDTYDGVTIRWSHYYVWSSSEQAPYLVNISGSNGSYSIAYYKVSCSGSCLNDHSYINNLALDSSPQSDVATSRSAAEERQNMANWYQYFRTRQLTALSSFANVVNSVDGMKIGIHTINHSVNMVAPRIVDTYRGQILDTLYNVAASGGTPLRRGLRDVGDYFDNDNNGPYSNADNGGQCQQAFTIMMTDGYYNGSSPNVGNTDGPGSGNTDYDGSPFADGYSNTLADVAMKYYENDLNSTLSNNVPHNASDPASHQHMVTYSVSFGLNGTLNPGSYDCPTSSCPTWPEPSNDDKKIDDLWHAAVNGRGKYMSAKNSQQLAYALSSMLRDVSERVGSGASVAVNTKKLQENTMVYQGSYNSAGWLGDLKAYSVSATDGSISEDPVWSASAKLDGLSDPVASRNIYTMGTNGPVAFTVSNLSSLSSAQRQYLGTDTSAREKILNYIRGDRSYDANHGGSLRARVSLLGDIVHSAPVHVGNYIFVGANDGMLHAFNATGGTSGGQEVFAYVPSFVYPNLAGLANPDYNHHFFVDLTPFVGRGNGDSVLLISGLGKGGKGYFCLDVTNPGAFSASNVLWEYPNSYSSSNEIENMGYSFSQAAIVPTEENGKVVIFGNGYDSLTAKAVLYVVNMADGSLLRMLDTGYGNPTSDCNGLSTPVFVDTDNNGKANYAYAGDLRGNIWKFDLNGDIAEWRVAYKDGNDNPMPLFQARDENGNPQPITTKLEVKEHCVAGYGGYIIIFGTGKFNAEGDFNTSGTQGVYGIWDWAGAWELAADELNISGLETFDKYLGAYNFPASGLLSNAYTMADVGDQLTLQVQQAGAGELINGDMYRSSSTHDMTWFNVKRYLELADSGGTSSYGANDDEGYHLGWYFPLPNTGERVIADPIIQMGYALIVSLQPSSSMCSPGGESYFYALNYCSGSAPEEPIFDINGDDVINGDDTMSSGDAPNSVELDDIYYTPVILVPPGNDNPLDYLVFGPKKTSKMKHQKLGMIFWRFLNLD